MKLPEFQYLLPGRYRASDALEYRHPVLGWIEVAQDGFYREIREVVGDLPPQFNIGTMTPNQARRMVAAGKALDVQIVGQARSIRSNSDPAFAGDPALDRVLTEILDRCETVNQVRVELYDHGLLREYPKVKAN